MSRRLKQLRKDIEKRRRQLEWTVKRREQTKPLFLNDRLDEAGVYHDFYFDSQDKQTSSNFFLSRVLISICLFLIIAILFKVNAPQLAQVRDFVKHTYEHEFQFATIAHWYENQFGRPLALVPVTEHTSEKREEIEVHYALPVNGIIYEHFEVNGRGIIIETDVGASIESIRGGYVISVGEDREGELGKTVTVQHFDGTESVYGLLNTIDVNIYDHIEAGTKIGTVSTDERGEKGIFYLGLKQGNRYIDPSDVLPFE